MADLLEFDCNKLVGWQRTVCEGTSGLPETGPGRSRENYLRLWANQPPIETFECIHRGPELRTEPCKICGDRDGTVSVYKCHKFSECTIHAHGIGFGVHKIAVCIACDKREPPQKPT